MTKVVEIKDELRSKIQGLFATKAAVTTTTPDALPECHYGRNTKPGFVGYTYKRFQPIQNGAGTGANLVQSSTTSLLHDVLFHGNNGDIEDGDTLEF